MSLINDALKKAQRQRGDEPAADLPPGPGGGRVARREKPAGFQTLLVRLAVGIVAVCAVIVTTVVLLRDDPAPVAATPPKTEPVATNPVTAPKQEPVAPKVEPPVPKADPAPVVAAVTPPVSEPTTPAVTLPSNPPATAPTTGPTTVANAGGPNLTLPPISSAPAIPAPSSAGEQDKRILAYLSTLSVRGIRPGPDPKVLMNDRVYRPNDVIDYSLGLKLTGVVPNRLEFVDERGVGYVKTF